MIDSTNPRIMADNIRHLVGASGSQASDISTLQATVEALGSYSRTEANTGMKYGEKDIYRTVFTGTAPTTGSETLILSFDTLLSVSGTIKATNNVFYDINKTMSIISTSNGLRIMASSTEIFQGGSYIVIAEYTKSASPAALNSPAPDDTRSIEPEEILEDEYIEPEVREEDPIEEPVQEVKKTTRKKSTN